MRKIETLALVILSLALAAIVLFFVPFIGKTPYQRMLRYYGTVLITQWRENAHTKFAFDPRGKHVRTAKEQLRVPVQELQLPVLSLWLDPKDKQKIDFAYKGKRQFLLYHEDRQLLPRAVYNMPNVDAELEVDGERYTVGVKLRGEGLWHWMGNPSYRITLKGNARVLGMGPRINLRRNEYVNILSFLLHFLLGEDMGLITPKMMLGHLLINGEYQGLRTVFEHYDEGFVERRAPGMEIFRETYQLPQETLYSYFGEDPTGYPHWNSLTAKRTRSRWRGFIDFLRIISLSDDDEEFRREIGRHLDVSTLLRFANLSVLASAPYLISLDNTWAVPPDGRLIPVVSDAAGYVDSVENVTRDPHEIYTPMLWRLFSLVPDLLVEKDAMLRDLLDNEASVERVHQRIDGVVASIDHDVAFASSDFHDAVRALKDLIARRHAFLRSVLEDQVPHLVMSGGALSLRARPMEEWIVEDIYLDQEVDVFIDGKVLPARRMMPGRSVALDRRFTPQRIVERPRVFDEIPEENPFLLAQILLYRQQILFREVVVPLTMRAVSGGDVSVLSGTVRVRHERTGERRRRPFSFPVS